MCGYKSAVHFTRPDRAAQPQQDHSLHMTSTFQPPTCTNYCTLFYNEQLPEAGNWHFLIAATTTAIHRKAENQIPYHIHTTPQLSQYNVFIIHYCMPFCNSSILRQLQSIIQALFGCKTISNKFLNKWLNNLELKKLKCCQAKLRLFCANAFSALDCN